MSDHTPKPITYSEAGVDIERGATLVERIKPAIAKTNRLGVMGGVGGFGGLFDLKPLGYTDPILVSATDGVGTKLKLAITTGQHDTIGIDLVAMCVNDIIVQGAAPLFFLDYFATGKLNLDTATTVVNGIAQGCEIAGAALLGGETAEMPGMYAEGHYDLAGFCVGAVERERLIDGSTIRPGDKILGLASDGIHSNGYSLVRHIIEHKQRSLDEIIDAQRLGEVVLAPTRIYVKPLLETHERFTLHGLAHITGGGITENLPRVLPTGVHAEISLDRWPVPPIFRWLAEAGPVSESEMLKTFNCGIGMIAIVEAEQANEITAYLQSLGETVYDIGKITTGDGAPTVWYRGELNLD